jgi:hypothetical protein
MKKLFRSITVVLLLFVSISQAQGLSIGPNVALNIASLGGKDVQSWLGSKVGMMIGGFLNVPFGNMFALQPELAFTMEGASGSNAGTNVSVTANYIELPVLLKFYIPLAAGQQSIRPEIYAGPAIGLNVAASETDQSNGQTTNTDLSSKVKSMDFSLVFGGGVGFKLGSGMLDFSLRYTLGLTTIDNSGNNATITTNSFAIVAGYAFSLK